MQNDFRTIAFDENCIDQMLKFVDTHWERVIDVRYATEYAHPGSYDAYLVKISPPAVLKKPRLGDILPQ